MSLLAALKLPDLPPAAPPAQPEAGVRGRDAAAFEQAKKLRDGMKGQLEKGWREAVEIGKKLDPGAKKEFVVHLQEVDKKRQEARRLDGDPPGQVAVMAAALMGLKQARQAVGKPVSDGTDANTAYKSADGISVEKPTSSAPAPPPVVAKKDAAEQQDPKQQAGAPPEVADLPQPLAADLFRAPTPDRKAGPAPGGGAQHGNRGKPAVGADKVQARAKALEFGNKLKAGKLKPKDKDQIRHLLEALDGDAYETFADQLKLESGRAVEEYESKEMTDRPNGEATTTDSSLVVPASEATVERGGFKVAYSAQIFEEDSRSTVVEVYSDVSGGAGIALEIPIEKVLKLKLSVDARHGEKTTERTETDRHTNRKGQTISRSFTVRHMRREVLNHQTRKVYHKPAEFGSHRLGRTIMAKSVSHEKVGVNPDMQHGYAVVPDEGGPTWGPFWNVYAGFLQDEKSGLRSVWGILGREQKKIAEDLVFGPPGD